MVGEVEKETGINKVFSVLLFSLGRGDACNASPIRHWLLRHQLLLPMAVDKGMDGFSGGASSRNIPPFGRETSGF